MESTESLNLLFSPSEWTKRGTADDVLKQHVKFITETTCAARKVIPCQLNVPYGAAEREKFDIYGIDLPSDAPIFVYIHGGYWQELSKDENGQAVESFYKKGIKVIVVGYTLCPNCTLKNIVQEIVTAFSACLMYAKRCESKGIYLCGHSAGAHLVASLFQEFSLSMSQADYHDVKAVFCISGVYDLTPIVKTYVNDALSLTEELAVELSPLHQEFGAKKHTKFYIIIGEYESPAFHKQSKLFYEKLKGEGCNTEFAEIKEVDHFSVVENLNDSSSEVFKLITKEIEEIL